MSFSWQLLRDSWSLRGVLEDDAPISHWRRCFIECQPYFVYVTHLCNSKQIEVVHFTSCPSLFEVHFGVAMLQRGDSLFIAFQRFSQCEVHRCLWPEKDNMQSAHEKARRTRNRWLLAGYPVFSGCTARAMCSMGQALWVMTSVKVATWYALVEKRYENARLRAAV